MKKNPVIIIISLVLLLALALVISLRAIAAREANPNQETPEAVAEETVEVAPNTETTPMSAAELTAPEPAEGSAGLQEDEYIDK